MAVLEGQAPGSHLLSGAVVSPRPLRELFRGRLTIADMPTYGEVPGEAVYMLTRRSSFRIPPPPTMWNHGNVILSLSELARFLAEQAEALGVASPGDRRGEAARPARTRPRRANDRGRGRHGEALTTFEPGSDVVAGVTVLAEGTQGLLTSAAIDHFRLEGENLQIWALGVKECGASPGRCARSCTRSAGRSGRSRATASSAAPSSTRWATTWWRSALSRPRGARRGVLGARRAPGVQDASTRVTS